MRNKRFADRIAMQVQCIELTVYLSEPQSGHICSADGYFVAGWKGSSQNYCGFDGKMKA
jgi:hypothetical protein